MDGCVHGTIRIYGFSGIDGNTRFAPQVCLGGALFENRQMITATQPIFQEVSPVPLESPVPSAIVRPGIYTFVLESCILTRFEMGFHLDLF